MDLPVNKHSALVNHITRLTGIRGETAGQIVEAIEEAHYRYLYALIINNKRDELRNFIKGYEPRTVSNQD